DDVARAYGGQFASSGFQLASPGLAAGNYRIFAFAHNVATGSYSAYVFADVSVAGLAVLTIDTPAASATAMPTFTIGGWAVDSRAVDGTGVDAVALFTSANGGADPPVFLGAATYGVTRGDVGAAVGARFTNSGYQLTASGLRPGSYMLLAYAHSTATGSYSLSQTQRFSVDATTLMVIDYPAAGAAIDAPAFAIMGWAIDRSASSGTGVDALHIYAYPDPGSGRAPAFLGVAAVGFARSDIASIFGSQFGPAGYALQVDRGAAGLTPGVYDIAVWVHSSVSNTFPAVSVVRVTLQ